jgi:PQQ-like domain
MRSRQPLSVLVLAVAVAVPGVSTGSTATNRGLAAARGWRRADLHAVTQPVAVGTRFVFYAARRGKLQVVAIDARTGVTVWTAPATSSDIAPGQPPALAVIGGSVFYLATSGRGGPLGELVARDARDGHMRWRSALGAFSTGPLVCPDAVSAICLTGLLSTSPQRGVELRFDSGTGKQLPGALISSLVGRELAPGLFDPGQRKPELLVATRGGRVSWRRPLRAVFTLPGASSDWGWNFDRAGRAGLFVGSPGWKPVKLSGTHFISDLSRAMTAGFRIRDGAVVWRSRGMYICNYLACPGGGEAGFSAPSNAAGSTPSVGVRTRAVGTVSGSFDRLPVASRSARATLEGFDPATGRTLWRAEARRDIGLITQQRLPPRIGLTSIVLRKNRRQLVALDLVRGSQRRILRSTAAWCRAPILYRQYSAGSTGNRHMTTYVGQLALFPCRADGHRRRAARLLPSFVAAIGARGSGVIAWTDMNAVVAHPAR